MPENKDAALATAPESAPAAPEQAAAPPEPTTVPLEKGGAFGLEGDVEFEFSGALEGFLGPDDVEFDAGTGLLGPDDVEFDTGAGL